MKSLRIAVLAAMVAGLFAWTAAHGQTVTTLHNFRFFEGSQPTGKLIQGVDSNFYGTVEDGGIYGAGTVYMMNPTGGVTKIYDFQDNDGKNPHAGLVLGIDSNFFYGTTQLGGTNNLGTVFKITSAGSLTTLYQFSGPDGANPIGVLIQNVDSNFYGTTISGGANNEGSVFKITPAGSLTTLYQFSGPDGRNPASALVLGCDSNFYGTTDFGGTNDAGTVFMITPAGSLTTIYQFDDFDGYYVSAELARGLDCSFYGTTAFGGSNNFGTVYQITPVGSLTTLYQFGGYDGAYPYGGLALGLDGNFYGTTQEGTTNNDCGTVFRITPTGSLTTLYEFSCDPSIDGGLPVTTLLRALDGSFYGVTPLTSESEDTVAPKPSGVGKLEGPIGFFGTVFTVTFPTACTVSGLTLSSCPSNISSNTAPGTCGATITFATPTAVNNCGTPTTVFCTPPSGTLFAQGTTTVSCTANDGLGHTTNCNFLVTVNHPAACGITISGNSGNSGIICQGNTVILTAPNGMKHYLWSGPEQNGAQVQTIVVGTPGTYCCTEEQYYGPTNCCCVTVVVNPPPPCNITGNLLITNGLPTTLVGPDGMKSQYWTGPQNNGLASRTNIVSLAGTYTLHLTDSNGCQSACPVTVTNRTPQACSITASGDAGGMTICQGRKTTLTAENGMVSYLWTGPEQNGATTQFIVVGTQGTYCVRQIDHLGLTNNCCVYLKVNPMPYISISGYRTICQGSTTTLCGPGSMKNYLWLGPQHNGFNTQCNTVNTPGTYTLVITDSNGCQNAQSVLVTVVNCPPP